MSKGSRQRTGNKDKFNTNYDSIFGDKNESDRGTPRKEAGKSTNGQASQSTGKAGAV